MASLSDPAFLEQLWSLADKNGDGSIDQRELIRLFHSINLLVPRKMVTGILQNSADRLNRQTFASVIERISYRHDLWSLFSGLGSKSSDLANFLRESQHMTAVEAEVVSKSIAGTADSITFPAFVRFMTSDEGGGDILDPKRMELHMDMTLPLPNYFIHSSHNTYLLGDQLTSMSSTEAYVRVLENGCRCVELDVWNGADKQNPIIYHGHTMTSKILFRDALLAIQENAFKTSPYPVILSLEVHCDLEQQEVMADLLKGILGPMLVTEPLEGVPHGQWPSPEQLKGKFLVKGKYLHSESADEETEDVEEEVEVDVAASRTDETDEVKVDEKTRRGFLRFFKGSRDKLNGSKDKLSEDKKPTGKHAKHDLHPVLGELAVYVRSKKFQSFQSSAQSFGSLACCSFSEGKGQSLIRKDRADFERFNQSYLTRIYPSGTRVVSTNLIPTPFWFAGCQMVAMNFQTFDKGMQLNLGFFHRNGDCGYLLKPAHLRGKTNGRETPWKLYMHVISAHRLPKPESKAEMEATFHAERHSTKHINDNGFNPIFETSLSGSPCALDQLPHRKQQNGWHFEASIWHPELTLLRVLVKDKDIDKDDLVGTFVAPVDCLRPGYRHIKLRNDLGDVGQGSVFVYTNLTQI